MTAPIRSRIIGHGEARPDDLLANPLNWRIHPGAQQKALTAVLRAVGIVQNVIVNQRTGHLIDGHLRVQIAMREGVASIPVVYVDLSEAEEASIVASFDPVGALAVADDDVLNAVLAQAALLDDEVRALLFDEVRAEIESGSSREDTAQRELLVIGRCRSPEQQVDAANALRAIGVDVETKP